MKIRRKFFDSMGLSYSLLRPRFHVPKSLAFPGGSMLSGDDRYRGYWAMKINRCSVDQDLFIDRNDFGAKYFLRECENDIAGIAERS